MGRDYPLLFAPDNAGNLLHGAGRRPGASLAHAGFTLRAGAAAGPARPRWPASGRCSPLADQRGRGLATPAVRRRRWTGPAPRAPIWAWSRARAGCTSAPASPPTRLCRRYRVARRGARRRRRSRVRPVQRRRLPDDLIAAARRRADAVRSARAPTGRRWLAAGVVFYDPGRLFAGRPTRADAPVAYLAVGPARRRRPATGGRGCWSWRGIGGPSPTPLAALARTLGLPAHRPDLAAPRRLAGRRWPASRGWAGRPDRPGMPARSQRGGTRHCRSCPLPFYGLNYV